MLRKLLITSSFLAFALQLSAQVYTIGTGTTPTTGATVSPYKTFWHDGRSQYLILASELLAAGTGPGTITALGFNVTTTPSMAMSDFTIKIASTSATVLGSTFLSPTNPTTVMGPTTVTISTTGWYTHTFATPFVWNGSDNVLIDVCFDNTAYLSPDGSVMSSTTSFASTTSHNTDGAAGCVLAGTGVTSQRPNMQLSITPATACVSPVSGGTSAASSTSVCPNQNFNLSISGQTLASGLTYQWESSATATGPWTPITGASNLYYTASQTSDKYYRCVVSCASASASAPSTAVQVTTLPNLAAGTYTIGSGGTYASFTSAFAAASCGVAGPVVFQVLANSAPFVEQIEIGEIPGMSATNTITVKGNGNTLSFTSASSAARHVLYLNGADYLRFEDLVIHATGTTTTEYGWALRLNNNANFNTFKRCIIKTNETLTSSSYVGITLTTSATSPTGTHNNTASNLTIDSCQVIGGYYGVCFNGTGLTMGTRPTNNKLTNSTISDFYFYGIYAYGQDDLVIEYNNINRATRSTVTSFYAMYNYGRNPGFKFNANRIHSPGGASGTANFFCYIIYGSSLTGTAAKPAVISNNAVYNINNGTSGYYGMYMLSADTINIYHNTLDFGPSSSTGTSTCYGAYFTFPFGATASSVNFYNNIISISSPGTGTKFGIYNSSTTNLINSNNNAVVYTGAGGAANWAAGRSFSVTYSTLAAWNTATGQDANSISSSPMYVNAVAGDVTPNSWAYKNAGRNVFSVVPADLNRVARDTTPDIGAIEFTPTGCPAPFNVQLSNVRATTASVSFTSLSPSVDLQWGPKGFTPGTGQGTTVTTTTVNIASLSSYTAYDLYVAGNCGSGSTSVWVGPYSFTTPAQIGWLETFNGGYDPTGAIVKPMSWTERNALAANPTPAGLSTSAWTEDGYQNSGTTGAVRNNMPLASNNTQGWTITPSLDLGDVAHTTYLEWDMANTLGSGTTAGIMGNDDTLFVLVSTNNGTTWNRNQSLAKYHRMSGISPTGGRYSLNLSAYTGLVKVAFYIESTASSVTHGATDYDLFLDNVALTATQTPCAVPNVTFSATSSSATLGWTLNGSPVTGGAQIAWGPAGFTIGSGGSGASTVTATTNPYTLSGLAPGTQYQVYLQTPCAAGLGQWVGPFTFTTPCLSALSGAYTVDSNGTGATNFLTLASAVTALQTCGVSGPVTLTLAGYVHPTGLSLAQIPGVSVTNVVTFQGNSNGNTEIKGAGGQPGAVTFIGTRYVKIQNLRINAPTMSGVVLTDNAQFITLHNNTILADTVGTLSSTCGILSTSNLTSAFGYGINASSITITNNVIKGGYYGIRLNGNTSTSYSSGFEISNNQILKSYYYGAYFYYIDGLTMHNNTIKDYRNTFNYGIYGYYMSNVNMQRNNVPNPYYYGLTIGYLNNIAKPASKSTIANNMFGSTGSYAVYLPYPRHVDMHYNTFGGSSYGLYMLSSTTATLAAKNIDLGNNIIKGGSYAYYQSGAVDSLTLNYNLYQSGGTNMCYFGTANFTSLSAWKTAFPLLNINSVQAAVVFASPSDLHVVNGGPNNLGTPIAAFSTDIDGDVRSTTTPDIGADEYTPINNDMTLESIDGISGCGDSTSFSNVIVKNKGNLTVTTYSVAVEVTGPSGVQLQTVNLTSQNLANFATDTVVVGPFNTYAGGSFSVRGWVVLAGDQVTSNDTLTYASARSVTPFAPAALALDPTCFNNTTGLLVAQDIPGVRYAWYTSPTDTTKLSTNDTLSVPVSGTTYYLGYTSSLDTLVTGTGTLTSTGTNITPYKTFYMDGRAQYIIYPDELQTLLGSNAPSLISGVSFNVVSAAAQGMGNFTIKAGNVATIPTSGFITSTAFATVYANTLYNAIPGWNLHNFTTPVLWDGVSNLVIEVCYDNSSYTSNSTVLYETLTRTGTIDGFTDNTTAGGCTPGTVLTATYGFSRPNMKVVAEAQACSNVRTPVVMNIDSTSADAVASFLEVNAATGTFEFYAGGSTGQTFTWTFGDGGSATGDTVTHSYASAGVFTATLTVTDSTCNTTDVFGFVVTSHIGLGENILNQQMMVYPNPNSGTFQVRISGASEFEGQLEVMNLMGQVVASIPVDKRSNVHEVAMDLTNYPKGVYMLRLSGTEGQTVLRVIVR
ncbi:MAG: right-handed parallel beta-helix repeat-containing protein [Cryomorphaceae bacterium]|nr:right-handed parallel beta-helix repeat-containing protein [Cryomorphaceae bacterium]